MWTGEDGEHKNEEEAIQKPTITVKYFCRISTLDEWLNHYKNLNPRKESLEGTRGLETVHKCLEW